MSLEQQLASLLRPMAVRQYAEARAWQPVVLEGARFWLFRHPQQTLRQLQIPMDSDDVGFTDAILDVVRRLAEVEQRSVTAVLGDLQWPDADILRVRVADRNSEAGQLSLSADVALREGVRRALLASACSVISPVRYHPRLSRREADDLLAACRAGQTERGSYVVKIVCPLHAVEIPDDQPLPFTRQVTRLLMGTTAQLVADIEQDRLDRYAAIEQDTDLSWNLCDALLRMRGDLEGGQVELATSWAADRRVPPPTDLPARVTIKADYFQEIEQVAKILRPNTGEVREQRLIGTVEQLSGAVGEDGRRAGEIVLTVLENNEPLRARAILDAEHYEVAMRAHERGDAYVDIRGVLHRGLRISRIDQIRTFALLDGRDPS